MPNAISRVARGIASIPHRILGAAGWITMEPSGLGVRPASGDVEDIEAERRRQREIERDGVDESQAPPDEGRE